MRGLTSRFFHEGIKIDEAISCKGGESITVTGTNFAVNPVVMFGSDQALVVSSTNTQIMLISPALAPGLYNFNLIGNNGNAQ